MKQCGYVMSTSDNKKDIMVRLGEIMSTLGLFSTVDGYHEY